MNVHELEIVSSFLESGFLESGFYAVCSCGWDGPSRPCTEDVRKDFERHLANVNAEAA